MSKTLNKTDNVVRVGEVLSFTIALTNTSNFTLTSVTVVDNYDNTVLAFARAFPSPNGLNAASGVITWNNVATTPFPLQTIRPGQSITLTVVFTAEHPKPTVVNRARAQDLVSSTGMVSQTGETSKTQEAVGGAAPIFKTLFPPGTVPQAGLPVTFTHLITNDGAAIMTRLPLTDTYNPAFLQFKSAIPTPTIVTPPGLLVWTDLTIDFGDIPPFGTVVVTTVFTATTQVLTTVNQASTAGATDQFGNDLTAGETEVPIVIVPAPNPTPIVPKSGEPEDRGNDDDDDEGGLPAPLPTPTAVPTSQLTSQTSLTLPTTLPETGLWGGAISKNVLYFRVLFSGGLAIFALSLFIWIIHRRTQKSL
jgi:uncharacterized repeat protein (TIGR01451 family)